MSLLSDSVLLMWHDIQQEYGPDQGAWHSSEHLPERLAVPGFLRGRRGVFDRADGTRQIFILYELRDLDVMSSPDYLARLNHPTPWSERINPLVRNFNRSPAHVVYSHSFGVGGYVETLRILRPQQRQSEFMDKLTTGLRDLEKSNHLTGCHLLEVSSGQIAQTREERLRGRPDKRADLVILFEGFNPVLLSQQVDQYVATSLESQIGFEAVRSPFTVVHVT